MDTLAWLLFESPLALGSLLALVNFVLLVQWRRGGRARPLLIGLGASAVLLLVQALIITQREAADRTMTRIERAVLAGQVGPIADALAFDFRADAFDRDGFIELARTFLRETRVRTLLRQQLEIVESHADRFLVQVSYVAVVSGREYEGAVTSIWRIEFGRDRGAWRIRGVDPLRLNRSDVTWKDLTR